jgi:hypothetical protein
VIHWSQEVLAGSWWPLAVQNRGVETAVVGRDPDDDEGQQLLEGLDRLALLQQTWAPVMNTLASRHSSAKMLHMLAMHLCDWVRCRHTLVIANTLGTACTRKAR